MSIQAEKRKRANGKVSGAWITKERRLAIYMRDNFCCVYCGKELKYSQPRTINLDHLLPRKGNTVKHLPNGLSINHESNLVTACLSCNASRQDKPFTDYATGGALERIFIQIKQPINVKLAKALIAGTAGNSASEALR